MQEDAPLVAVRLRVVKLLGHLGGTLNRNLVTGKDFHLEPFVPCNDSDPGDMRTLDCD